MPDVEWNIYAWETTYNWQHRGEEWSSSWGTSEAQWFGSLYPRLHRQLPAKSILEIAPGFGRWTRFLITQCRQYVGVDLSSKCIDFCSENFASAAYAKFVKNDGSSLAFIEDGSVDLIFSFDSMVHIDDDILEAYIEQMVRKLTDQGVAFIHHSNAAALGLTGSIPHVRSPKVSAAIARELIVRHEGHVLSQEIINWGTTDSLDCITRFTKKELNVNYPTQIIENNQFMLEAQCIKQYQPLYSPTD